MLVNREAKVERVEYAETIEATVLCTSRVLGQVSEYECRQKG
jgi:GTP-binding protein HflX